jgi:hypothetical protein
VDDVRRLAAAVEEARRRQAQRTLSEQPSRLVSLVGGVLLGYARHLGD